MTHLMNPSRRNLLIGGVALGSAPLLWTAAPPARAAAAMLGPSRPTHYSFKLGAFELTSMLDADAVIDGPWPLIGGNTDREEVDRLMQENLLPTHKYRLGFTPLIVNTGRQIILFDAGNGAHGFVSRPKGGWLASQLAPAGFSAEQIDLVVLSHGHPDHVGGLMEGGKPLFPNADYAIGALECDFWSRERHSGEMEKLSSIFRSHVVPLVEKTKMLRPGDDIAPGIRTVEAYGHTPGHLALHIESKGAQLLFWGDCAHHQVASLARPDWTCVFDVDKGQAAVTRQRIFDMAATDRLAIGAYHMPFPSLGYLERRHQGGYRWLPHSYQLDL